jgi:hypothetical protein
MRSPTAQKLGPRRPSWHRTPWALREASHGPGPGYRRSADSVLATEYGCRISLKHIPFVRILSRKYVP